MTRTFICYRRSDAASAIAGRLNDTLVAESSEDAAFMDVLIPPGSNFVIAIRTALETATAVLVLIDPEWLTVRDDQGRQRLANPDDFVRLEIREALQVCRKVIPVLICGARMPQGAQLPDDIAELALHQALTLTHERWATDIELLLKAIRPVIPGLRTAALVLTYAGAWTIVTSLVGVVLWASTKSTPRPPAPEVFAVAALWIGVGGLQIAGGRALQRLRSRLLVTAAAAVSVLTLVALARRLSPVAAVNVGVGVVVGVWVLAVLLRPEVWSAFERE